jgi:hypothetical protein
MRARTAAATAVLAATAALLLTACGGSGSNASDKISGAPATPTATSAGTSAGTAKAPASGSPVAIDPAYKLPAGLNLTFDWALPADHVQAAALNAAANFMQSLVFGVVKQSVTKSGLGTYATGGAYTYAKQYVQLHVDARKTLTGADLFYRPAVKAVSSRTVVEVTFCENATKLYSRQIPTGKVHVTAPSDADYTSYDIVLAKAPAQTEWWQAQSVNYKERAVECRQ